MIQVRAMQKKDIDSVHLIETLSFSSPWSRASLQSELTNSVARYRVLTVDEQVVGFCGMWVMYDEAHVTNIAIHPDYRGRGLGRTLLAQSMKAAVLFGARAMTLEVRETNTIAQGLYASLGFVRQGYRRGYYTDTGEGALLLWNTDIESTVDSLSADYH